jgi:hypothetical protein
VSDDLQTASRRVDDLRAFYMAQGQMIVKKLMTPRPGERISEETNLAEYWEPSEVCALFRQALKESGCSELTARELIELGKAGRLARLREVCAALGIRPVLLERLAAPELTDESEVPELWSWIFWCFTAPPEDIGRAGAAGAALRPMQQSLNSTG